MSARIRGHAAPAPRLTRWGVLAILAYLGLPLLAVLALADLAALSRLYPAARPLLRAALLAGLSSEGPR